MRVRVLSRRRAGDALEDTVEMVWAHGHGCRQTLERRKRLGALDQAAGLRNLGAISLMQRRQIRLATLAGPKARCFRRARVREETHVLGARAPRAARWPTVHARGGH